jgi:hypothetical protein
MSLPGLALLSSLETIRNLLTLQATCLIETHEQKAVLKVLFASFRAAVGLIFVVCMIQCNYSQAYYA